MVDTAGLEPAPLRESRYQKPVPYQFGSRVIKARLQAAIGTFAGWRTCFRVLQSSSTLGSRANATFRAKMVGVAGFEPAIFSSRTRRDTGLRYTPKVEPVGTRTLLWSFP